MDAIRKAALSWLRAEQAKSEAEKLERAVGWAVVLIDRDFGGIDVYGVFDGPIEAMEWAARFQQELNEFLGEDERGWVANVYPVLPRD
jgi:hypothetical protein